MLMEGQIIELSSDKEYIVMKVVSLHSFNYVYLVNTTEPHDILIGTISFENDFLFNEIKDNNELEYILTVLNPSTPNEEFEDVRDSIKKNGELLEQSIEDEQLDKDQILMQQYSRETNRNMYGSDTFDRYMSHNLYKDEFDMRASIKNYIKSEKGRKFLMRRLAGTMDVEKLNSDFDSALPEMINKIGKVLGIERRSDKEIEEEYTKKKAA